MLEVFSRVAPLTQNKKLKKNRKYLIQGLIKEKVSARLRFNFLSIFVLFYAPKNVNIPRKLKSSLGKRSSDLNGTSQLNKS
jgi:hypothetical protein